MSIESDVERRVLAHLPAWRDEKGWEKVRKIEIAAGGECVESYTTGELTDRMAGDAQTDLGVEAMQGVLEDLEAKGLAAQTDGDWRMTELGLNALLTE